jgi:hypothetical protein
VRRYAAVSPRPALGRLAQQFLEFGEDLLDVIEIGAGGRQNERLGADRADGSMHSLVFVAAEIVDDDDVAGRSVGTRICPT